MTGAELRNRRRTLKLSQAEFARRMGISRDYLGQLERGVVEISGKNEAAAKAIKPTANDLIEKLSRLHDPLEQIIFDALIDAGIRFTTDQGGGTAHRLDFHLTDFDIAIEVKRMHTPRSIEQMSRVSNGILVQGPVAVRFLAEAIRSGDFVAMANEMGLSLHHTAAAS